MLYTAVIGDLVDSRSLQGGARREIQRDLTDFFRTMTLDAVAGVASQPTITLGDEFQALFSTTAEASASVSFLTEVQDRCRPARVRFGLGVGSLSTDLTPVAIGMDGPCFHRARTALELSRDKGLACAVRADDDLVAEMLSFVLSQLLRTREAWSAEQREAIEVYLALPDRERSWTRVAEALHRSPSAITQRQQGAQWRLVQALGDVAERALARLESGSRGGLS